MVRTNAVRTPSGEAAAESRNSAPNSAVLVSVKSGATEYNSKSSGDATRKVHCNGNGGTLVGPSTEV